MEKRKKLKRAGFLRVNTFERKHKVDADKQYRYLCAESSKVIKVQSERLQLQGKSKPLALRVRLDRDDMNGLTKRDQVLVLGFFEEDEPTLDIDCLTAISKYV